jgi:hypothetical protein
MKKLFFIIITIAVCTTLYSQQINQLNNRYRSYDVLEKKQVSVKGFDLNSKNGIWSLEDAELSEGTYNAEYSTESDTLIAVERGDRTYFSQDRGTVSIIGSENYMERMSYDMPEAWLKFPMQLGDSISGYFNGTGPYCERLFMRRFGTYLTVADAVGKLVLPEGDTLRHVLRLHTERHVGIRLAPIDTMKCKIPIFTVDSIVRNMAADSVKMQEDIYRWYADGYRYPVLEASVLSRNGKRLTADVYYCSPDVQRTLAYDEENEAVRERLAKEDAAARARSLDDDYSRRSKNCGNEGFAYNLSLNDGSNLVTIHYDIDHNTKMTALVANTLGYVYRRVDHNCDSGNGQATIDCKGLRKGQYIIYINVDGNQYAEKVNVK